MLLPNVPIFHDLFHNSILSVTVHFAHLLLIIPPFYSDIRTPCAACLQIINTFTFHPIFIFSCQNGNPSPQTYSFLQEYSGVILAAYDRCNINTEAMTYVINIRLIGCCVRSITSAESCHHIMSKIYYLAIYAHGLAIWKILSQRYGTQLASELSDRTRGDISHRMAETSFYSVTAIIIWRDAVDKWKCET